MGLLGSIFGGGSTKVNQTTKQTTNVNTQIDVSNAIDISTEQIAEVLAQFAQRVTETTEDTKKLIAALAQENAIDLLDRLKTHEMTARFYELVKERSKQAGVVMAAFFGWWFFFREKGRKK